MDVKKPFAVRLTDLGKQLRQDSASEPGQQDASKAYAILKLAALGLLAGLGLGYLATSLLNGDLAWLQDIGLVSAGL